MGFDKEIETNRDLALRGGQLRDAIDALLTHERTARLAGDIPGTTQLVVAIVTICHDTKEWTVLNETIQMLAKRRAQLKQAIQGMVQEAAKWVNEQTDPNKKLELITTLRAVTEGKIYVEVERARLSLILSQIHEKNGKLDEARTVLQDTQVETLGDMDKREKSEFILEQVRLCLDTKDYMRAWILAKKINLKHLEDASLDDIKVRYYKLVIRYHMHSKDSFELFRAYQALFEAKTFADDKPTRLEMLRLAVTYLLLSPHTNEQHDQLHRFKEVKELAEVPAYERMVQLFTTDEIFAFGDLQQTLQDDLAAGAPMGKHVAQFDGVVDHVTTNIKLRCVQHNIRVVAKCYKRMTLARLSVLLGIGPDEVEKELSEMVTSGAVYARIDRPAGVVNFKPPQHPNELLNDWSGNISQLLNLLESTCHQIRKESMVHNIA